MIKQSLKRIHKELRSMAYLGVQGQPIIFPEAAKYAEYIKEHAIEQFINLYKAHKKKQQNTARSYKWGSEIEYHVVRFDHANKVAKLDFRAHEYINMFNDFFKDRPGKSVILQHEYGGWMFEAIPSVPFPDLSCSTFAKLANCYRTQRSIIRNFLPKDTTVITIPSYPMLGSGQYASYGEDMSPLSHKDNKYSQSLFTFDKAINTHPRFPGLTKSIRMRRGRKVEIKVPLFMDENTSTTIDTTSFPGWIYMDSMAFGMGCCCLQLTVDSSNIDHAKLLSDQLHVFSPIFAALSAATPAYKGFLSEQDLRLNVVEQCVDDRTKNELIVDSPHYVPKSRYSMINHYISSNPCVMEHHNDAPSFKVKESHMDMLSKAGIDPRLAYHIAAVCSRDPLVLFSKAIELDDTNETTHFENLQSTNWNSVRFKPPSNVKATMGWRIEFRPLDVQLTDYENAAMAALVGFVVRLINDKHLNFIIPISKCDENMKRAHKKNAVITEKFYFRTNIENNKEKERLTEMTISEIIEGKPSENYKGLLPRMKEIIEKEATLKGEKEEVMGYLGFLKDRARGKYKTGAKFIREYILNHKDYKKDSIITPEINYDLMNLLDRINSGTEKNLEIYKS